MLKEQINSKITELKCLKEKDVSKVRSYWNDEIEIEQKKLKKFSIYFLEEDNIKHSYEPELPKDGNYAVWTGNSGAKKLQVIGEFKTNLSRLTTVRGGASSKIAPLLNELGFIYKSQVKEWKKIISKNTNNTLDNLLNTLDFI